MSHCEHTFKVHGLEATTWLAKKEHWEIWREHLFALGKQACVPQMFCACFGILFIAPVRVEALGCPPHDHEMITKKSWERGLAEASITPKRKAAQD